MNKKVLALCGIALVGPIGTVSAAPGDGTFGGRIQFVGTVVNAACAVEASSTNMTVVMGQIRTATIDKGVGKQSDARIPFEIVLGDCDPSVSESAAVSFYGVLDSTDTTGAVKPGTALVAGIGTDSSNGVGLQIFDAGRAGAGGTDAVVIDNVTPTTPLKLNPGQNALKFQVGYVSLVEQGLVEAGDASASVNFNMHYF